MTEREAKDILDAYEYHNKDTGEVWRLKYVLTASKGELYDKTAYGFVTWSYSDKTPPDKAFAFRMGVGANGVIKSGGPPLKPEEAIALYERSFSD